MSGQLIWEARLEIRQFLLMLLLLMFVATALAKAPDFDVAKVQKSGLSAEQARQVLTLVLVHEKYRLCKRGLGIEGPFKGSLVPGYFSFSLEFESAENGATQVLGMYRISKFTGDVWEFNLCQRYDFPKLKEIQAAIMKKTGKSFADETAARRRLGCTDE